MSIQYVKGDCLQDSKTERIICHIVNNQGGFGAGFALAVAKKYPKVRDQYKKQYTMGNFSLNQIQIVSISHNLKFINMCAQDGYKHEMNTKPLSYEALEICLLKVNFYTEALKREIWMPKIGSGLAGGDWNKIEQIINSILKDREIKIFEL